MKFEGYRPTRTSSDFSQSGLEIEAIDLDHDAINLIGKRFSLLIDFVVIFKHLVNVLTSPNIGIGPQAPFREGPENLPVGFKCPTSDFPQTIAVDFKGAIGSDL